MKKWFFTTMLTVIAGALYASHPELILTGDSLFRSANISLLVTDVTSGETICDYRSEMVAIPASTMKLVTTAAVMEMLGPDFRFETTLSVNGQTGKDGTLKGNLIVIGGGDPTLGSEKNGDPNFLKKWVEAVRKAGIKKISGSVIGDDLIFDNQGVNPHWTWEDIGNYYAAGAYGIAYKDNTCRLYFKSGKPGTTPKLIKTDPQNPGFTLDNQLKSSTIQFDSAYVYGSPKSDIRYILGEIPAFRDEFIVKSDIPNPALLLASDFTRDLEKNGIHVNGQSTDRVPINLSSVPFYTYQSPPLSAIVAETNIHSNNLYAEQLLRYLGAHAPANSTTKRAIETVKAFWKSKNLPVDQLFMYDGCGLAPSDAVSARFFVDLLTYMYKSPNRVAFYNSLPVAGESGTLKNFLVNTPLQGKVHAKSGTISGVKSYAGYVENNGKTYAFALLMNHAAGSSNTVTSRIEKFLLNTFISEQ